MSPRSIVLVVLLLLMEVLAGFSIAVGSSLLELTSLQYGMFWLFLLAGLAGIAVSLILGSLYFRQPWDRITLLVTGAIVALVPAHIASTTGVGFLVATLLLGLAYWRGSLAAQEPTEYGEVQARFGIGFGILFIGLVWIVARGVIYQKSIWHMLTIDGIAYTIAAMLALVLARIDRVREPGATQAVVLAVAMQLGLLALISLAALLVFSHDLATALFNITRPFWDVVGMLWLKLLILVFAPIEWLIGLLHLHAHPVHINAPPPKVSPSGNYRKRPHAHRTNDLPVTIAGLIFMLALVVGICWLIWYTVPRLPRPRRSSGFTEERSGGLSPAAIWRGLRRLLARLLNRGAATAGSIASATRTRILGPVYPEDPVRRVYAQMLYRARSLGVVRPPSSTPSEFQQALCAVWPEGTADFAVLTAAYEIRRYGWPATAGSDEVEMLRDLWQRLRTLMRRETVAPVVATVVEIDVPAERRRRLPIPAFIRESQAIRQLMVDLGGAAIALVFIVVFVIVLIVLAVAFSGK